MFGCNSFFHRLPVLKLAGEVQIFQQSLEFLPVGYLLDSGCELLADGFRESSGCDHNHAQGRSIRAAQVIQNGNVRVVGIPLLRVEKHEHTEDPLFYIRDVPPRPAEKIGVFTQERSASRSSPLVGHVLEVQPLALGEELHGHVRLRIGPGGPVGEPRLGLGIGDEIVDGLERRLTQDTETADEATVLGRPG